MSKYIHYFGIDVSKNHLDICLIEDEKVILHKRFDNTKKAWRSLISQLKKENNIDIKKALFCLETTGDYSNPTLYFLNSINANIWLEMPIQIQKSQGFKRGKNDIVDAQRIAWYAYTFKHLHKQWEPARKEIEQLKKLKNLRDKIVKNIGQYSSPAKDSCFIEDIEIRKFQKNMGKRIIRQLKIELAKIELKIQLIINKDKQLNHLSKIVLSVTGIGIVTAVDMIVCTNEFKSIETAKQFACYSGVAPFEISSGLSTHKTNRISQFANKNSKRLLHMAAMSAIVKKGELRDYYLRKTTNGKPKMVVLNAVRNKIIQRVYSCVKNNRMYTEETVYQLNN